MDRELLTLNGMTGWMLFLAFLVTVAPGHCPNELLSSLPDAGFAWLAGAAVAVVSAPFLGWLVGGLVVAFIYAFFKTPYRGQSRQVLKEGLLAQQRLSEAARDVVQCARTEDEVFVSFYYRYCPPSFIEWARRRHTTRFLSYNWLAALLLGVSFGCWADWQTVRTHVLTKAPYVVVLAVVVVVQFLVGRRAAQEVETAEHIWVGDFLARPPCELTQPPES